MEQGDKKYELTGETLRLGKKVLHRIRALKDFGNVKAGERGGYIEKEENLSHAGLAWVADDAKVYENARISGNALVSEEARVCGNAYVCDNAQIYGKAIVCGRAHICGNAHVYGGAFVNDMSRICGNAQIYENALVFGYAQIYGYALIHGDARIRGVAIINGCADISNNDCLLVVDGIGPKYKSITFFIGSDEEIYAVCGCFSGTLDELTVQVWEAYCVDRYSLEYRIAIKLAKLHIRKIVG